jgi:hypothetical protein
MFIDEQKFWTLLETIKVFSDGTKEQINMLNRQNLLKQLGSCPQQESLIPKFYSTDISSTFQPSNNFKSQYPTNPVSSLISQTTHMISQKEHDNRAISIQSKDSNKVKPIVPQNSRNIRLPPSGLSPDIETRIHGNQTRDKVGTSCENKAIYDRILKNIIGTKKSVVCGKSLTQKRDKSKGGSSEPLSRIYRGGVCFKDLAK